MIDVARMSRWRATAKTWNAKTVALLVREAERARGADQRWLVGYDAAQYLEAILWEAQSLVPLLHEDQIEDAERYARELAALLRAHRLAGKLEHIEGRTPEEAAAFLDRAAALRGTR